MCQDARMQRTSGTEAGARTGRGRGAEADGPRGARAGGTSGARAGGEDVARAGGTRAARAGDADVAWAGDGADMAPADGDTETAPADGTDAWWPDSADDDAFVLAFGHLVAASNRLSYILGRALEERFSISHQTFEVLVILARAGESGLSMGAIAQEQVLSTGGVTRLIDRMEAAGLVLR